jgi:hypothetical protein
MIAKKISSSVVVRRETSLSEIEEEQSATDDSLEDVEEQGTEPDKEPEKTKRKYATAVDFFNMRPSNRLIQNSLQKCSVFLQHCLYLYSSQEVSCNRIR